MRICSKCKIEKSLDSFAKDKSRKEGVYPSCKACRGKYYKENKNIFYKLNAKYKAEGKRKRNCSTYYSRHIDILREKNKNYSKNRYYSDDLFKYTKLLGSMVRRLLKQKTKTDRSHKILGYTAQQLYEHLTKYFNNPCVDKRACIGTILTTKNSHIDHIIPLSKGISIEERIELCRLDNLRLVCNQCNLTKSNKEN